MFQEVVQKIQALGDKLVPIAGQVVDIGVKKAWLTEWDIKIERELTELIQTFPGQHSVYAEEISDTYVDAEHVWIIDPISSTLNFIHGLPHYAVVLSYLHKGEIQFATVYDPAMGELFTAEKGKGCLLNNKRISVSERQDDLTILLGTHLAPGGQSGRREKGLELAKILSTLGAVRILGSLGVHYAYVACGRADVAVSLLKDVFPEYAGRLLVEEAGGVFTDLYGKNLELKTRGIIAANNKVHQLILDSVQRI